MDISPLPFRSLTFLSFSYLTSVQSLTLGVPYFTTNQQHGIPCFINEDPPDWPVWTRVCVVKGPAQGAMARTKRVEKEKRAAPSQKDEARTPAESKEPNPFFEPAYSRVTPPQSRPLKEEDPQSRPLKEEDPQSREKEEETTRLSASSDEAVLDTSLSAQSKESASSSMNVTVMSKGKEITTVLTVLGRPSNPPNVQRKTGDSAKPVHEDEKEDSAKPVHEDEKEDCAKPVHEDEGSTEVDYEADSADEEQHLALRNPLSCTHLALRVEPDSCETERGTGVNAQDCRNGKAHL